MKLINTSNQKEIEWLEKEGHIAIGVCGEEKEFEVEEDVNVPNFKEPEIEKKTSQKSTQKVNGDGIVKDKKITKKSGKKGKKK